MFLVPTDASSSDHVSTSVKCSKSPSGSKSKNRKKKKTTTPRSARSEFDWNEEDALKEKNITEAVRKFSGHLALQEALFALSMNRICNTAGYNSHKKFF